MMQYFVLRSLDTNNIIALYRFKSTKNNRIEEIWNNDEQKWNESKLLFRYLSKGEPALENVTLEKAKNLFPNAFIPVNRLLVSELPTIAEMSDDQIDQLAKDVWNRLPKGD